MTRSHCSERRPDLLLSLFFTIFPAFAFISVQDYQVSSLFWPLLEIFNPMFLVLFFYTYEHIVLTQEQALTGTRYPTRPGLFFPTRTGPGIFFRISGFRVAAIYAIISPVHPLFRNIQVINWHKYKESTNKNAKYVNSLFVC